MARQLIWLGFFLRVLVSFWNGYFGPSFGADGDAAGFHLVAAEYSRDFEMDRFVMSLLYSYGLGIAYRFTTPSLFLGGVYSALAWLASAFVLLRIMRLLSFSRNQRMKVMFLYALLPSAVLWTGVTLREAYQLLFVNLALYASLRIFLHKSKRHWAVLLLSAAASGALQPGLFGFGVFVVGATSVWLLFRRMRRVPIGKLMIVVPFTVVVGWYGFSAFISLYEGFGLDSGLASAIESYQRGALSVAARTNYKTSVSIDSFADLILFFPVALFQYLFEPMPWRPVQIVDILTIIENMVRAVLLWNAMVGLGTMPQERRKPVLLIFASWLVLETMFAVGTVAWGTSMRHHIPSMGLLLVVGFARTRRRRVTSGVTRRDGVPGLAPASA